eukprot:TRINITY_DN2341_c0_g1_i1.p1 TRINITY_DN2341_c0_g1~~TRINITY_DN2341_c0_g1_i1.p1  ORF type:complete len:551 (-),score=217.66 TRINITY_DN2341_c0_g1_i1:40-1623(-)
MRSALSLFRTASSPKKIPSSYSKISSRKLTSSSIKFESFVKNAASSRNWCQNSNASISFQCGLSRSFSTSMRLNGSSAPSASQGGIVSFNLADIGEGIAECELLKWHIKEGDTISQFDPICEVQSDKATVEITSRFDGVVKKLYYSKGQMAKVGSPLVDIDTGNSSHSSSPLSSSSNLSPSIAPNTAPDMGPSGGNQGAIEAASVAFHNHNVGNSFHEENAKVMASPAVRHMARTHNINLKTVKASGKDGRITKEDILKFISDPKSQVVAESLASFKQTPSSLPPSAPQPEALAEDRVVPLTGYSRIMAKTMVLSNSIPHFGYSDEVIADGLISLRKQLKKIAESEGVKLTYMPIIIKATSLALSKYPTLNSSFNAESSVIIVKGSHNIGVAMNTPNGLVVPNIKDVQKKSILEIARELNRLQAAASTASLQREDLSGGTFSISNIGTIGGTYASPVIVPPEVAIGAIGKIQKLPRFDHHGSVVPQHIFNISWSADHRVIDGATIANFSNLWKDFLENPSVMLFQTK